MTGEPMVVLMRVWPQVEEGATVEFCWPVARHDEMQALCDARIAEWNIGAAEQGRAPAWERAGPTTWWNRATGQRIELLTLGRIWFDAVEP